MLDLQIKQKELTSERMLDALAHFQKLIKALGLQTLRCMYPFVLN